MSEGNQLSKTEKHELGILDEQFIDEAKVIEKSAKSVSPRHQVPKSSDINIPENRRSRKPWYVVDKTSDPSVAQFLEANGESLEGYLSQLSANSAQLPALVSYVQHLVNTITVDNFEFVIYEFDKISTSLVCGGVTQSVLIDSFLFRSLVVSILDRSKRDWVTSISQGLISVLKSLVERLDHNQLLSTVIYLAFSSISKQRSEEPLDILKDLLHCFVSTNPLQRKGISALSDPHVLGLIVAFNQAYLVSLDPESPSKIFFGLAEKVESILNQEEAEDFKSFISTGSILKVLHLLENSEGSIELTQSLARRLLSRFSSWTDNTHINSKMDSSSSLSTEDTSKGEPLSPPSSHRFPPFSSTSSQAAEQLTNTLADLGPACTRNLATLRDTFNELLKSLLISRSDNDCLQESVVMMDEASVARLIWFFSARGSEPLASNSEDYNLSSALVSTLVPSSSLLEESSSSSTKTVKDCWNLEVVSQYLSEKCFFQLDWSHVARRFDFSEFCIRDVLHLESLLKLYRSGAKMDPPLLSIFSDWSNRTGQLSLIEQIIVAPPQILTLQVSEVEEADATTVGNRCANKAWASEDLLKRLLYLSDIPHLARRVRDLFVKGIITCPEVLLCSLVRLQLNVSNTGNNSSGQNSSAGNQMKCELMRELIPLFFKPNVHHRVNNAPAALKRLWSISPNTVTAACVEAWRSTSSETPLSRLATAMHVVGISRLLPDSVGTFLNNNKDYEFSIAVAFVMIDNELLQLSPWLNERFSSGGISFIVSLVTFLGKYFSIASPRNNVNDINQDSYVTQDSLVSLENLGTSLQFLNSLDRSFLNQPIPSAGSASDSSAVNVILGDSVKALTEACVAKHASLNSYFPSLSVNSSNSNRSEAVSSSESVNNPDDIEEMANSYFQRIYASEQSIGEVIEMLKRFKLSGNTRENEIFACMIRNLFDEYRFFSRYPEKELRITGILFGQLIQNQLVFSITLGIGLRYVLEALRKSPGPTPGNTTSNSSKMFRFGMFALEQFKTRLHEWPQYCSHIVQIPHLKQGYADLVNEIEGAMTENQSRGSTSLTSIGSNVNSAGIGDSGNVNSNNVACNQEVKGTDNHLAKTQSEQITDEKDNYFQPLSFGTGISTSSNTDQRIQGNEIGTGSGSVPHSPLVASFSHGQYQTSVTNCVAVFGPKLGRAVNGQIDSLDHDAPTDAVLDRVQFLINNVSPSNVEQKARELKKVLAPKFFGWLGNYLVVKRISTQPNFHSLYLAFLDQLGDFGKGLVEAILSSVYVNVGKLLRSPKITTSTSERSLLKNLGSWLGQITLARNRPILQIMLDCKELLFQGYETGMLIAVTPFVAKILEGAKNSIVFRPPNPWLMGLLSVFRALYGVDDLKMNIKFEVEVLCKNLGVKLEDIPLRTDELTKRISPVKERNPDFNLKSSMSNQVTGPTQVSSNNYAGQPSPTSAPASPNPANKQGLAFAPSSAFGPSINTSSSESRQLQTVIPNLAAYVTINSSLSILFQQSHGVLSTNINEAVLKRAVPLAVDRAIREIIQPVVERSVTIACITTKEIVTKDFAMESDENIMRKAAQLMVANLAGSLALVTCREPLRVSVSQQLRQLLMDSAGSGNNTSSQLSKQEQNCIEQCVSICSSDNLELGCMLIEKAATEKAVRDMDEALSPAMSARRKHREQATGSRFPAALPDPLRPKPGGLRQEQLLVYEAFQRMPRQPTVIVSQQSSSSSPGGAAIRGSSSGAASSPVNSNRMGTNMNSNANQNSKAGSVLPSLMSGAGTGQSPVGLDALSTIAVKIDAAVTSLLSAAGPRASEITLSMLPPDHDIKQLLLAVQRVALSSTSTGSGNRRILSSTEVDSILVFAQSVFKRLYDLSLSEPLRLEALVALLEALNECFPQLGQDLAIWVTYAPTETDGQRKLHRTILLLLVRSRLIPVKDVDVFLSRNMEHGRNSTWVEFALLFVRTAVLERIAVAADMCEVMDILAKVADGRVQGGQQIDQSYLKLIRRLIDELRGGSPGVSDDQLRSPPNVTSNDCVISSSASNLTTPINRQPLSFQERSSIGPVSLNNLAGGTKKALESLEMLSRSDPPAIRRQVSFLLDSWIRIHSEASGNEKALVQYLQLLQQHGIGKADEITERFIRVSMELVVDSVLKSPQLDVNATIGGKDLQGKTFNYSVIDAFAKLISLMIRYLNVGGTTEQIGSQRISLLNKILATIVRALLANYERCKLQNGGIVAHWDQRPWFRLFLNLVHDLNTPSPALDPICFGILSVFGSAFHIMQPLVVPGFAFAWLELISHRMFLSNLLLVKGQKGWGMAHQLLIDLFLFLEPHLSKTELTEAIKHLYKGTLRVLLVLLHDFPSFLAGYHLSFCNVVPENCIQLRNLILSAFPRGMVLPDPFTPNLKIDLLPEISRNPAILSNVSSPLGAFRTDLDSYLKARQPSNFLSSLLLRLCKEGTNEADTSRINSLVLYVGCQAIARMQNTQVAHTPEVEVIQRLMDLDDRGRYISLNALANQLRYPSSHTHYFSCVILFLFSEAKDEGIKEQITRVLLERLIVHRPHPWGLLITFIELIKNQRYQFWSHSFTRCATEIEKVFESVARSCMSPESRAIVAGGEES